MENAIERTELLSTAGRLATTIEQLTGVLIREVDGVYTLKNNELASLYQDKTRLLADYAAGLSTIRGMGGNEGVELPADLSARLRQNSAALMQAMERNVKTLQVAHEASRQVVDVIIDAVKQQRRTGAAYGKDKNGGLVVNEGGTGAAAAVTLDTRL